jgi:invasion protein IalB
MKKLSVFLVAAVFATLGLTATVAAKPGKPHSPHAHAQKAKKAKHAVHGVVEAVGSDSITLTLKNGDSLTIPVIADTKIRVNGKPGSLSDIQVGYRAEAKLAKDGSAKVIDAKDAAFKSQVHGVVSAVGTDSITLKLKNGDSVEIAVTSATKIHLKCGPGTIADIEVGFRAKVKRNSDGSARRIQAVQPHFKCVVHGAVSAVGTDSLTLTLKNGSTLTVAVTADTDIYVNGAEGSLADIQVGYVANVKRNNDGSARRINAHAPDSPDSD